MLNFRAFFTTTYILKIETSPRVEVTLWSFRLKGEISNCNSHKNHILEDNPSPTQLLNPFQLTQFQPSQLNRLDLLINFLNSIGPIH